MGRLRGARTRERGYTDHVNRASQVQNDGISPSLIRGNVARSRAPARHLFRFHAGWHANIGKNPITGSRFSGAMLDKTSRLNLSAIFASTLRRLSGVQQVP